MSPFFNWHTKATYVVPFAAIIALDSRLVLRSCALANAVDVRVWIFLNFGGSPSCWKSCFSSLIANKNVLFEVKGSSCFFFVGIPCWWESFFCRVTNKDRLFKVKEATSFKIFLESFDSLRFGVFLIVAFGQLFVSWFRLRLDVGLYEVLHEGGHLLKVRILCLNSFLFDFNFIWILLLFGFYLLLALAFFQRSFWFFFIYLWLLRCWLNISIILELDLGRSWSLTRDGRFLNLLCFFISL